MEEKILDAYQKVRQVKNGTPPELTAKDREAARLAARYSESELRQAVVMRAAYERSAAKVVKK